MAEEALPGHSIQDKLKQAEENRQTAIQNREDTAAALRTLMLEARERHKMTVKEIAEAAGVSRETANRIIHRR